MFWHFNVSCTKEKIYSVVSLSDPKPGLPSKIWCIYKEFRSNVLIILIIKVKEYSDVAVNNNKEENEESNNAV